MGYRFEQREDLTAAIRRIVGERLDAALQQLAEQPEGVDEAIHEARKACKKARATLRLVRPGLPEYSEANAAIRDAARRISDARDAQAFLEGLDALAEQVGADEPAQTWAPVRAGLVAHRDAHTGEGSGIEASVTAVREDLEHVRETLSDWQVDGGRYDVVAHGIAISYKRGRQAYPEAYAEPSAEAFHEWRKRAKYHRYHLELLSPAWPALLDPLAEAIHDLTDLLGDDHDLAELGERLEADPEAFGGDEAVARVVALAEERRAGMREAAHGLGARIFAEPASQAGERFAAYLRAWEEEAGEAGTDRP